MKKSKKKKKKYNNCKFKFRKLNDFSYLQTKTPFRIKEKAEKKNSDQNQDKETITNIEKLKYFILKITKCYSQQVYKANIIKLTKDEESFNFKLFKESDIKLRMENIEKDILSAEVDYNSDENLINKSKNNCLNDLDKAIKKYKKDGISECCENYINYLQYYKLDPAELVNSKESEYKSNNDDQINSSTKLKDFDENEDDY